MKIENNKVYHLPTKEAWDDFMQQAETQGFRWASGLLPTRHNDWWYEYGSQTTITTSGGEMTYGSLAKNHFLDFIKWKGGKQEIGKIYQDGNKIIVKVGEETPAVKIGMARCNPNDEFDTYTGIKIALDRAFGKLTDTKETTSEERKKQDVKPFKLGERVQFKTWDEMEKEYGINEFGNIECKNIFVAEMMPLCESYATISCLLPDGNVFLYDFSKKSERTIWNYSTDMIKHIDRTKKGKKNASVD